MRYTAAALARAEAPIPIALGASRTRWGRWWRAWFRSWEIPPLSARQMLRLQGASGDPARWLGVLAVVLREQLPRRWWHAITGDPVVLIMRLPDALRRLVLAALLQLPETGEDLSQQDPVEAIRAAQRRAVYGATKETGPSFAVVCLTVQQHMGAAWYDAPHRWPTTDGYAPFAVVWLTFVGLQALAAQRRLEVADGLGIVHAKDPHKVRTQWQSLAYPHEVH